MTYVKTYRIAEIFYDNDHKYIQFSDGDWMDFYTEEEAIEYAYKKDKFKQWVILPSFNFLS
jgi:hypothetical protein